MSTNLQKNLARNIVDNLKRKKPLNKKELVVSSGYDETTAEKQIPAVFEQKGVKEELAILGFDEASAKKVVAEIMLNDKVEASSRLKATDQVFKVQGSYAAEKSVALNLNLSDKKPEDDKLEVIRAEYEEKLKARLIE